MQIEPKNPTLKGPAAWLGHVTEDQYAAAATAIS
jgi:hypothetical protein